MDWGIKVKIDKRLRLLSDRIRDNKSDYLFCLAATLIFGLISHAYGFFNAAPSHDWLNGYYADSVEESVKVAAGRFFVPVYRAVVRTAVTQPWLVGLIGLFFLSIAVFFVVRFFGIRSKKLKILVAGIMVTNVTITAQIATYLHEFDFNMLALALAVIAAYVWHRYCNFKGLLSASLLLLVSVCIYQSYFAVCVTLMMIASMLLLLDGEDTKKVIIKGLKGIGMILFALLLYFIIGKIIYLLVDIPQQERTEVFDFSGISNVPLFFVKLIVNTYLHFAASIVDFKVYDWWIIFPLVALTVLTIGFIALYTFVKNRKMTIGAKVTVLLLGILLPVGTDVTFILTKGVGVHDLMIYAVWLVYVLLLCAASWLDTDKAPAFSGKKVIKLLAYALVLVLIWQNILISNSAYLKKEIDAQSTLSMMTRVVSDLEDRDDYVIGKTELAFVGITETQAYYGEFGGTNGVTGIGNMSSPISQDIYTSTCNLYSSYFRYVLNYPVKMCSNELHEYLKDSPQVKDMPCYPEKGYMEMIDGVLVVKMGERWYSVDH